MNSQKNVLIAGATGLIGRELVNFLLEKEYKITVITRDKDKAFEIFKDKVAIIDWLEGQQGKLNAAYHAIINLSGASVGEKRWSNEYKREILDSRIQSVKKLHRIVQELPEPPKAWVQASAVGYYGSHPKPGIDESGDLGDGFLAYVVNVWESVLEKISLPNTRVVFARFGIVLSEHGAFLKEMSDAFNKGIAVCPGSGKQKISWVHIIDAAKAIELAINIQNIKGKMNVVAPNAFTMCDFSQKLKQKTKALITLKIPAFVFQLAFGKQKANEMMLASQDIKPGVLLENNFDYRFKHLNDVFNGN